MCPKPKSRCCTVEWYCGPFRLHFNPIVSLCSVLIIWGFVIWAMVTTEEAKDAMLSWKLWITQSWTWLYIGTYNAVFIFIVVIYFSKYSSIRLGKDNEKPEFSDISYFTMLFAAGVGTGLFYFAVAEPVYHYTSKENRFHAMSSDNRKAQDAINITLFHWGIHGYAAYVLVSLLLALMGYKFDLPMTMRSCFYPILGDKVFGRLGDMIDIISVVCTMFGVCTSLGMGAMQLNAGINRLFPAIPQSMPVQLAMIWIITAIATISVVSGVKMGIRRLSETCFAIGMLLLLTVFLGSEPWFLLNLIIQSVGYYFNFLITTGSYTEAFAQMNNSRDEYGSAKWMDSWTIFYFGWWSAYCSFVGMFIAKISRGRTIKDFIFYTLTIPATYILVWFSVFGGKGIQMEREAARLGLGSSCGHSETMNLSSIFSDKISNGVLTRLSCRKVDDMLFDLMGAFEGISGFLSFLSIVAIVLYFVTSSDSGSLVIDCLTSNGDPNPPVVQRIFWSITEGGCATALLVAGAGKKDALQALQAGSVCTGLFFTIVMNFMALALWRSLRILGGDIDEDAVYFASDLVDPLFFIPGRNDLVRYIKAVFAPWYDLSLAGEKISRNSTGTRWGYMLLIAVPFQLWAGLLLGACWNYNVMFVGWACYIGFATFATGIRSSLREQYNIVGNVVEDFFSILLAYPLAVIQIAEHLQFLAETETFGDKDFGDGDELTDVSMTKPLANHAATNTTPSISKSEVYNQHFICDEDNDMK